MSLLANLSAGQINTVPMDLAGNKVKIIKAVELAMENGCGVVLFPELVLSGAGCAHLFKIPAFVRKCQDCLIELTKELPSGVVVGLGLPVLADNGLIYNAYAVIRRGEILGLTVKYLYKHDNPLDDSYRYFATTTEDVACTIEGKTFYVASRSINCRGFTLGVAYDDWPVGFTDCDVVVIPNDDPFELGSLESNLNQALDLSREINAIVVKTNLSGCESGTLIYDGQGIIVKDGKVIAKNSPFSFKRENIVCEKCGIAPDEDENDLIVKAISLGLYDWMVKNLGYNRLQMGGQGGIVANALAVAGVQKVIAHTNSLPKLQAEQFLKLNNLVSYDEKGMEKPACEIDRQTDIPLIHWIIEFDKGDSVNVNGEKFVCPKSNRFIATYDPLNLHLVVDENFIRALKKDKAEYIVLSGFHALTEQNDGVKLQDDLLPVIKDWKAQGSLIHLEIASTQDIAVRKALIKKIAPLADSIGINEREAIDILEVIGEEKLAEVCNAQTTSVNMFKALLKIKNHIKAPRIQLHMFGLYITLEDKGFRITPEANLHGMMLAATVAAGKAGTGNINKVENLLWACDREVSDTGLQELSDLADFIGDEKLVETGIASYDGFGVIALPTIIIEKPLTLVGMGDTISSLSLLAAR